MFVVSRRHAITCVFPGQLFRLGGSSPRGSRYLDTFGVCAVLRITHEVRSKRKKISSLLSIFFGVLVLFVRQMYNMKVERSYFLKVKCLQSVPYHRGINQLQSGPYGRTSMSRTYVWDWRGLDRAGFSCNLRGTIFLYKKIVLQL